MTQGDNGSPREPEHPPADQFHEQLSELNDRVTNLETQVNGLNMLLAKQIAAQAAPLIQQRLENQISDKMATGEFNPDLGGKHGQDRQERGDEDGPLPDVLDGVQTRTVPVRETL